MITVKNLSDYDLIKGKNDTIDKGYPMVKMSIEKGLYDKSADAKRVVDKWIEKANEFLKKNAPKEDSKSEKEPKKKPKSDTKKDTKKEKTDEGKAKKTGSKKRTSTKKETKADKSDKAPKEKKEDKTKVGEKPAWLSTLQSFVNSYAGQSKDTWRVRNFVRQIQGNFNAKLGQKTPNIALIREIQTKLIPYANSDKKKVSIPSYADLVSNCKAAIKAKDFVVSKTVAKPEIKETSLSGLKKKRKSSKRRKRSCR